MRPLTEEETKELFEKLSKYIGENVKLLIDRPDGNYCFRLAKDRIFYVREGKCKDGMHHSSTTLDRLDSHRQTTFIYPTICLES